MSHFNTDFPCSKTEFITVPLPEAPDLLGVGFGQDLFGSFSQLREVMELLPRNLAVIAGGAVAAALSGKFRSHDIDIFFLTEDEGVRKDVAAALESRGYQAAEAPPGCQNFVPKPKESGIEVVGASVPVPVQLVVGASYSSPDHVLDGFDLTCCQFAIGKSEDGAFRVTTSTAALAALRNSTLTFHRPSYSIKANGDSLDLLRVLNYMEKGFSLTAKAAMVLADRSHTSVRNLLKT